MSSKIEQIVEVIQEVSDNFRSRGGQGSISNMRINAGHSVAVRWKITNQSVIDKFIRQLRPNISSANQFDKLLEDWLVNNSVELKEIIYKHRSNSKDTAIIEKAFFIAPEEEVLLSEEFDYSPNDDEFKEGKKTLRLHLIKERNHYLVKDAKAFWLSKGGGDIKCCICTFSFFEKYGKLGKGYIEAHHVSPISSLKPDTLVKVSDIVPVCSNCHSIIHKAKPWLSIDDIKKKVLKLE